MFLFGALEDTDVEWLSENGQTQFFPAGSTLIREGTPIENIFIVLDGKLSVTSAAMRNKELAALFSGEVVGEMSFVDSQPPSASVIAASDSQMLAIPKDELNVKLASDPRFAARFYRGLAVFLADRLRTTSRRFGYGSAAQDADPNAADEMSDEMMDMVNLASVRFDKMLRRLRVN